MTGSRGIRNAWPFEEERLAAHACLEMSEDFQAHRHPRGAAEQGQVGLAHTPSRSMASRRQLARPTPCPSGPAHAGITSAISILKNPISRFCRSGKRNAIGCRLTCTSAAWNTRCFIFFTRDSGTRCSLTSAHVSTPVYRLRAAYQPGNHPGRDRVSHRSGGKLSLAKVGAEDPTSSGR